MLKIIEFLLWSPHISRYEISKTTGISPQTLQRYVSGLADIENMTLKNGLKLKKFYEEWIEKMKNKYGSVEYEGKEYILLDQPFVENEQFEVDAVDEEGNLYRVYWNILEDWDYGREGDAINACDWDNPANVVLID